MSDRLQAATNAIRALEVTGAPPSSQATVVATQTTANARGAGTRRGRPTRATARAPVIGSATQPAPEDQERSEIVAQAPASDPTGIHKEIQRVANKANPVETAKEAETVPEAKEVTLANELQAQKEGDFAKAKILDVYPQRSCPAGRYSTQTRRDVSTPNLAPGHFAAFHMGQSSPSEGAFCCHSIQHFDQIALGSRSLDLIGFGLFYWNTARKHENITLTSRSSHEAIPDLNFPPEDTTIEPPWFPGPSTPPSLSPTASALNEKPAEPIPMPSTPEGIFTADGSSPPSKRKWESDASSPEDFAMADASPSSSKRGQDPDSPTEKRGKIRSVADIMEETSPQARTFRKALFQAPFTQGHEPTTNRWKRKQIHLKSTFHPGELPSGGLPQFFDIYNWNYVQASSQGKIKGNRNRMAPEDGSLGWFIDVLNSCKDPRTRDPHSFFWIPRAQAVSILEEYKRLDFDFGDQFQSLDRSQTLRDIVLKVSDEKLDLDKYPVFTNIHTTLEASLKSRMQSEPDEWSLGRIKSIILHVQKLNKITTFLLISYLSLFKEHPNEYLSAELVSSILSFLEKFWMEIDGGKSDILKDHPLLQRNSELLKTSFSLLEGKQMSYANHVDFMNNEYKQLYPMAWNIIAYWVQINKKKIQTKSRIQRYYHRSVTELIGNIILSANSHRLKLKFNKYAIRM
ncbi:hypothetical protein PSTT_10261, partial [Puccinia striiformis]